MFLSCEICRIFGDFRSARYYEIDGCKTKLCEECAQNQRNAGLRVRSLSQPEDGDG